MRTAKSVSRFIVACAALSAAAPVLADQPQRSRDWTLTLGVEGRVLPEFEGSNSNVLRPSPVFSLRRAGTPARFRSPRDGSGAALIDSGPFKFGPSIKIKRPRKESDNAALSGLGDVGWTLEAGAFAEYWPSNWLRTRLELRRGFGGHDGVVGDAAADIVMPLTDRLTVSGGPRLSAANAAALSPYYSITTGQSAASGLPVYSASSGLKSWGAGAQVSYQIDPNWRGYWFLEYEQLAGDVARSPLVTQRGSINQVQVGIGLTRSFDIQGLW